MFFLWLLHASNPRVQHTYEPPLSGSINWVKPTHAPHAGFAQLTVHYAPGQNSALLLEAERGCIGNVWLLENGEDKPLYHSTHCGKHGGLMLDMEGKLKPGKNVLRVEMIHVLAIYSMLFATPLLFGAHVGSSVACVGLGLCFAVLLFGLGRRAGLASAVAAALAAGFVYYAGWLVLRSHFAYTNDLYRHFEYARYISLFWVTPPSLESVTNHPPAYYFLCALLLKLSEHSNVIHPFLALRLFSLVGFMLYVLFGLLCLKEVVGRLGKAYVLAGWLFVFWPLHILLATRINNDIFMYTLWGAMLWCLARWQRERGAKWLGLAAAACGAAFGVKTTANLLVVMLLVYMACVFGRWRPPLRAALNRYSALAAATLAGGLWLQTTRSTTYTYDMTKTLKGAAIYRPRYFPYTRANELAYFLRFDINRYFEIPYAQSHYSPDYWSYLLRTALYGEQRWGFEPLAKCLNGLLLAFLGLLAVCMAGLWRRYPKERAAYVPLGMCVVLPVACSIVYSQLYYWLYTTQDFRYLVPVVIPMMAGLAGALHCLRGVRGWWPVSLMAAGCAVGLGVGGVALYLGQFILLEDSYGSGVLQRGLLALSLGLK